jgi:hypothetical protein
VKRNVKRSVGKRKAKENAKDLVLGILGGLALLVVAVAVLWPMASSSDADREKCRSQAEKYGSRATCIVVVR